MLSKVEAHVTRVNRTDSFTIRKTKDGKDLAEGSGAAPT